MGALISATGSSQGPTRTNQAGPSDVPSSGEIFRVAQIGRLRVLVSLPQSEASGIHVGQAATVSIEELPADYSQAKSPALRMLWMPHPEHC